MFPPLYHGDSTDVLGRFFGVVRTEGAQFLVQFQRVERVYPSFYVLSMAVGGLWLWERNSLTGS